MTQEQIDKIVRECNSNPKDLKDFMSNYKHQLSKKDMFELYKRLINLQGHF